MRHDVVQPALPVNRDARQSCDRLGLELAVRDHAQPPRLLGDQHAAVGEERERPGLLQAFHHLDDAERMLV